MNVSIFEVFELNRVLHKLLEQQSSYNIQIAFKIHTLIKWLDETEKFIFERLKVVFGEVDIDMNNPLYSAFLSSQIPFVDTSLTVANLLETNDDVKLDIKDVAILEKMLYKTDS
jgi:hypothetical protein